MQSAIFNEENVSVECKDLGNIKSIVTVKFIYLAFIVYF